MAWLLLSINFSSRNVILNYIKVQKGEIQLGHPKCLKINKYQGHTHLFPLLNYTSMCITHFNSHYSIPQGYRFA